MNTLHTPNKDGSGPTFALKSFRNLLLAAVLSCAVYLLCFFDDIVGPPVPYRLFYYLAFIGLGARTFVSTGSDTTKGLKRALAFLAGVCLAGTTLFVWTVTELFEALEAMGDMIGEGFITSVMSWLYFCWCVVTLAFFSAVHLRGTAKALGTGSVYPARPPFFAAACTIVAGCFLLNYIWPIFLFVRSEGLPPVILDDYIFYLLQLCVTGVLVPAYAYAAVLLRLPATNSVMWIALLTMIVELVFVMSEGTLAYIGNGAFALLCVIVSVIQSVSLLLKKPARLTSQSLDSGAER